MNKNNRMEEIKNLVEKKQYKIALQMLESMDVDTELTEKDLAVFAEVYICNKQFSNAKALLEVMFKNNATRFKPLDEVKDRSELEDLVSDVAKFVRSNLSKQSEMKQWIKKNVETLEDTTGRKLTSSEFLKFDRFMKEWHKRKNLKDFDSERVADLLEQAIDRINLTNWDIILSDFDNWVKKEISSKKEFNEMLKRSKQNIKNRMN